MSSGKVICKADSVCCISSSLAPGRKQAASGGALRASQFSMRCQTSFMFSPYPGMMSFQEYSYIQKKKWQLRGGCTGRTRRRAARGDNVCLGRTAVKGTDHLTIDRFLILIVLLIWFGWRPDACGGEKLLNSLKKRSNIKVSFSAR